MAVTSLVAVVAPRTGKIIKNDPNSLKEEKIRYKMVYYTLYISYVNRQKSFHKVGIYTDE